MNLEPACLSTGFVAHLVTNRTSPPVLELQDKPDQDMENEHCKQHHFEHLDYVIGAHEVRGCAEPCSPIGA